MFYSSMESVISPVCGDESIEIQLEAQRLLCNNVVSVGSSPTAFPGENTTFKPLLSIATPSSKLPPLLLAIARVDVKQLPRRS